MIKASIAAICACLPFAVPGFAQDAPPPGAAFRFLYFGDPQDGIVSHRAARVVRAALAQTPDARFAIHAGDLVNIGSRAYEWAAWFESVGFVDGMIPARPTDIAEERSFDDTGDVPPPRPDRPQ